MKKWIILFAILFSTGLMAVDKVLTVALGDEFYYGSCTLDDIETFYQSIKGKGINISWGANPLGNQDILNNPKQLQFYREAAEIIRSNGIGVAIGTPPNILFPYKDAEQWYRATLDPETGRRITEKNWDIANPLAMEELEKYTRRYMEAMKPRELFYADEIILINPGKDAHVSRMSAYWTSPTYSDAALKSFRLFLKKRKFPRAEQAKFPVTTKEVKANPKANMGLPAILLNEENKSFLVEDNRWPDSPLWRAWYDWREDILTSVYEMQIKLAEEVFSDNPNWQGSMLSNPDFWYCRETGLNLEKLAKIPHLKYLVAGYMGKHDVAKLRPFARKNGKLLGGMVELSCYGNPNSASKEDIVKSYERQVKDGARLMLIYPLASFNPKRTLEKHKKVGMNYKPEQIQTWKECVEFLRKTDRLINKSSNNSY